MNGMTIKQIAETCGVDVKTVRRWVDKMSTPAGQDVQAETEVKKKMRDAGHTGKPTYLTLEGTLAIVRAGGRHTLASLLEENAKKRNADDRIHRLPNGVQLTELRRIYGPREAARRIDFAIGYARGEAVASPEEARAGFEMVKGTLKQKQLDFNNKG